MENNLENTEKDSFKELGINENLIAGIEALGFVNPTPIQEKVIPLVLQKRGDLVGLAQTGTGKTAAFGLPLIQNADLENKRTQTLVLCPTRELCLQIARDIKAFARHVKGFKVLAIYGGASIELQIKGLVKPPQIIVATPGRLLDLMNRKKADISAIDSVVLDEADEMLNMGFKEDLTAILEKTPQDKATYLFSATMPREVADIARRFLKDPSEVTVGTRNSGADNVRHLCYSVAARNRYPALKRIVDINPDIYGIVFCRTRNETREVAEKLMADGYNADALHGDLSQAQRDHVMDKFRAKQLQMIVATDIAARGLDVTDLTHIINYNLPDELQSYTHRSGRTGRAGKSGTSIVIIHQKEKHRIRLIEKFINKKFAWQAIPDGNAICEKQLLHLIDRVKNVEIDTARIAPFLQAVHEKLAALDREQLIQRFVALEFNRFIEYYRNAPDLNAPEKPQRQERKPFQKDRPQKRVLKPMPMSRFFINVGRKNKVSPPEIIGMINDFSGKRDIEIGRIEIQNSFSFFEIDSNFENLILKSFKNASFADTRLTVQPAEPDTGKGRAGIRNTQARRGAKIPPKSNAKKHYERFL